MRTFTLSISTIATILLASFSLGANRTELRQAIDILDDPKTAPQKKLAIFEKIEASFTYIEDDQRQPVLAAVGRQTRANDQTVARAAWKLLSEHIVDPATLIATQYQYPGRWNPAVNHFLSSGFDQLPGEVLLALQQDNPQERFAAMKKFAVSYASTRKTRDQFSEQSDSALASYLECLDRSQPAMRPYILMMLDRMHPIDLAVPVYLRALAGDDALAQQLARGTIDRKDQWIQELDIQKAIALALTSPDPKLSESASELLNKVQTEELKGAIADIIASAAARGDLRSVQLVKTYQINPERFAKAIDFQLAFATDPGPLLQAAELTGADEVLNRLPSSIAIIAHLLARKDKTIGLAAARILTSPKSRAAAQEVILKSVKEGITIFPEVLREFKPDPSLQMQLIPLLESKDAAVVIASVQTLAVTGVEYPLVAAALNPLLRHRDLSIRQAAAEAINTPQARARVLVPQLLSEAGSPSLATRQRAARQLDELNVEPKPVTAALVTATESGDFAVRQGILDALAKADRSGQSALDALGIAASEKNDDLKGRAYARAALREVQRLEKVKKP